MCFMSYADTVWIRFTFGKGVFWSPPNCFRSKMNRLLFLSLFSFECRSRFDPALVMSTEVLD